jgi:hypothetical protein
MRGPRSNVPAQPKLGPSTVAARSRRARQMSRSLTERSIADIADQLAPDWSHDGRVLPPSDRHSTAEVGTMRTKLPISSDVEHCEFWLIGLYTRNGDCDNRAKYSLTPT